MIKSYKNIRFFLFTHSYSGKKNSLFLKGKFNGKKLTKTINSLSVVLGFKYKETSNYILLDIKPDPPYKRLPYILKVYLEIENELSKITEEKSDEYSTALDDYQRQLLYPAIERASGNFMKVVDNDSEFEKLLEEKIKSVTHIYYKIAYKYKLPTLRVVPFILRLIS